MRSVLGDAWVVLSIVLVSLGLANGSAPLVGLGVLIVGTGGIARLWARTSLAGVAYRRELPERRAFAGETLPVTLRLINGKRLPVPWIEVREQLPIAMPSDADTQPSGLPGVVYLTRQASLSGREQLTWPLHLSARKRGYFRLGPARLRSGDLFGLFEREEQVRGTDALLVYPRMVSLPELGLQSTRPFGDYRGGSRLFEDPVRLAGLREYEPGDPLGRIDWKATARATRLQSRVFEPSHSRTIIIALNISTMEHSWQGHDPVLLERNVTVAASLARWAFESHHALGLIANGSFPDADRPIRIGAGHSPDQLVRVLEALAVISAFATGDLAAELERRERALPGGATVLVITSLLSPELAAVLHRLRSEGYAVHVVKTSPGVWTETEGWSGGGSRRRIPIDDIHAALARIEAEAAISPAGTPR